MPFIKNNEFKKKFKLEKDILFLESIPKLKITQKQFYFGEDSEGYITSSEESEIEEFETYLKINNLL